LADKTKACVCEFPLLCARIVILDVGYRLMIPQYDANPNVSGIFSRKDYPNVSGIFSRKDYSISYTNDGTQALMYLGQQIQNV